MPDMPGQPVKHTPEEGFRSSLDDTIVILESFGPECNDLNDLIGILKLALTNDSQLRLLMKKVAPLTMRGRGQ